MRSHLAVLAAVGLLVSACGGGSSPTTPSTPPATTPAPAPTLYTITGQVTVGVSTTPIANAVVRVIDGPNSGLSAMTDGNGRYTISGLTFAGFSVSVTASSYLSTSRGVPLTAGVTSTTLNFSLLPTIAWSQSGTGNNVFTMPSYFQRVRIIGIYNGYSSNFVVRIAWRLVINELVGTGWNQVRYEGVHLASGGGTTEITISSGVAWSFIEER